VAVNLATLVDEINLIQSRGIELTDRLWIFPRCHVVMPYHPLIESIYENAKGEARTGSTKRGMGPVFADKAATMASVSLTWLMKPFLPRS
jgi:adenylosuccinate synthase